MMTFGLTTTHINTVESMISDWNNLIDSNHDYSFSSSLWNKIGIAIGWDSMTAALYYIQYLRKRIKELKNENKNRI